MKLEIFVINWKKIPIQTQLTVCIPRWNDNVKIKFTKMDRLIFTNLDRII